MKRGKVDKLWRATQWFKKRFAPRGIILMYHRVAEVGSDPWSMCVTAHHFSEHLEVLQKHANPISLKQLAQAHQNDNIPDRAVAVTFDDGYADNLHNAKPLLERYNIPATVFVTTGQIEQVREFWWDELDRLLLQPGQLPEIFCLRINGSDYEWRLGEAAHYSEEEYQHNHDLRAWEGTPDSRHFLYYSIWQLLQTLQEDERRKTLEKIATWSGVELVARKSHRSLLHSELCALVQGTLIEVGAHTVTHPLLSSLSVAFQQEEIQRSKAYLEEILGRPVTSFSYPHGDYTEETILLIRDAGFTSSCSTVEETVWRKSGHFQLPRFEVQNWNREEFEQRLLGWLHS